MPTPLEWKLSLEDRLSGPATRINRQLGEVRAQLKKLDIAAKENALAKITDPLRKQRAELQLHRDKLLLSKGAMEKHGSTTKWLGERLKAGREALRDWLLILDPVARGLHFVSERAAEMGKRIISAVSFKQGAMIGLESMFGGKGGSDVFERMERLAGSIGKPIAQLVELARSLALVGAKQGDLEPMVRLIEDLDTLRPGAGERLAGAIRSILSAGKMTSGDVEGLRGALDVEKIYKDIGGKFGAPNKFAGKAILDTEVGVGKNIGIQTLLHQVLDLEGGKAGSASGRGGQTPQAKIDRVGIQIERMFSRLSSSSGVKAFGSVLDNVIDIFNPDSKTGQKMFKRLEQLSTVLGKALGPLTGPDGKKSMVDFFTAMAQSVEDVLPGLKAIVQFAGIVAGTGLKSLRGLGYLKDFGSDVAGMVSGTLKPGEESEATRRFLGGAYGSSTLPGGSYRLPTGKQRRAFNAAVTVNVDARGASKDDAEHIAEKVKGAAMDAISDALDNAEPQEGQ